MQLTSPPEELDCADPENQRIQNAIQALYNEQQQRAQRTRELIYVINELDKPQTLDQ